MSNKFKVLSSVEVDYFIEYGYVILLDVFAPEVAVRARDFLWEKISLDQYDSTTWIKPIIHHTHTYSDGAFAQACTQKLFDAYDDLMGEGRYIKHNDFGWWPITFPGFHSPPWTKLEVGWHVDGIQFHHRVNSREQGLLPIFLFSDIAHGGGGTALKAGSHRTTARILQDAGEEGLSAGELSRRVTAEADGEVIECTGRAMWC